MAKCERLRQAYSDYKHLSTDNLSFVAGLRGRPVPAPVANVGHPKHRQKPKARVSREQDEEVSDDDDSSLGTQAVKQACPGRSCAPRAEKLEAMMEQRVAAQTARHRAQSRLGLARERSQEAETKLEETKAELIRMSKAITEGSERMESLRDTLRNEGSINKAVAEELDTLLVEAMNLRREFTVDTLPPRPTTPIVPPDEDDDERSRYEEDGRTLESPITAPGQQLLERKQQQEQQTPRDVAGGAHCGGREWIHSGQLKHTGIFIRPPRPGSSSDGNGGRCHRPPYRQEVTGAKRNESGDDDACAAETGASVVATAYGRDRGEGTGGAGQDGAGLGGRSSIRVEGEDAWSCCGKTVVSAGRGCEPREPLATPEDLLLDTIDPRSRLGRPMDFRDYLPRTAWLGLSPDALHPFAGNSSEGTLRPHTAPERLMDTAGRWSPQTRGRGDYDRRAARSRNGGLIGGVWASGGRKRRADRGGLECAFSPAPDSGMDAWWKNEMADRRAGFGGGSGGRRSAGGAGVRGVGVAVSCPRRHEFLRRSQCNTASTTTTAKPRASTHAVGGKSKAGRFPRSGGGGVTGGATDFAAAAGKAASTDGSWPRTQILGMNGGRLPRQVRQASIDRPLTAPCGKVGRRRVRTSDGTRGKVG
ncbi:unnamed protein product [Scytosiphon promiscuus]